MHYPSPPRLSFALLAAVCLSVPLKAFGQNSQEVTKPLPRAHAHNDYRHPKPLLDALSHGFCSVEADIFLVDGKLLVGHDRHELTPERTLQALYLDPLLERVKKNDGRIFKHGPVVTLLVDIKDDGRKTYLALRDVLEDYREMLSGLEKGIFRERAVQIVISGNRPFKTILDDVNRLVGIDGRLTDLDSDLPAHAMPLISDRWSSHFRYRGADQIANDERDKLIDIIRRAHKAGRTVRFWATPESETLWQLLVDSGVDHINTDQLERLQRFLLTSSP